jgi:hypothetical protein
MVNRYRELKHVSADGIDRLSLGSTGNNGIRYLFKQDSASTASFSRHWILSHLRSEESERQRPSSDPLLDHREANHSLSDSRRVVHRSGLEDINSTLKAAGCLVAVSRGTCFGLILRSGKPRPIKKRAFNHNSILAPRAGAASPRLAPSGTGLAAIS